ncbi:hypothetical protein AC579_5163 [Pseudocercospora musae]|uniref:F-box domain-containing protein n=1 Tax=Pseudocercospora musae TaxID=113226 RepID=A0A139HZZ6_9PEZI|nr:hypothetical protein AC579_5163 [Pseudocercospora musae]
MTLTNLPPELFELVAQYALKDDLPSLRLVSRDCYEKSLRPFGKAYCSDVKVLLHSEGSLRGAIKRTEHPIFGSFAQSVSISIDEYRVGCGRCKALYAAQEWIRSQRLDVELLTLLFRKLRVTGRCQEVKLVTASTTPRWTLHQKYHHDTKACLTAPLMRNPHAFEVIMAALSSSGLEIQTFAMENPRWSLPLHMLMQEHLATMQHALRKTRSLDLDAWTDSRAPASAHVFVRSLEQLGHLRNLTIRGRDQSDIQFGVVDFPDATAVGRALLSSSLRSLRSISLTNISMFPAQLADFAHRHSELLTVRFRDPWFLGTRDFDIRYHLPDDVRSALQRLTGKDHVEVAFDGGWDSWKWASRVSERDSLGRW